MAKSSKINIGDRFGKLTILANTKEYIIQKDQHRRLLFLVRCDCGNEFKARIDYLSRGDLKSCKECYGASRLTVAIGNVYDQLTVIGFNMVGNRKQAMCKCSCGNIVHRRAELLTRINLTNNCGCKPRGGWSGYGNLATCVFNRYKQGAIKRDISFEIDIKYAWKLFEKQNGKCALSGLDIYFDKLTVNKNTASLDRIDSTKGYTKDNVQWVHKDVNYLKMDQSQDRIIELCKLIAKNN